MRRAMHIVLLVLLILVAAVPAAAQPGATPADATPISEEATPTGANPAAGGEGPSWLQVGPDGALTARAVSTGDCPEVTIDEVAYVMDVRAEPSENHPVTVCETVVPAGAISVSVGGTPLRVPVDDPQRVLVIGDGGCRMEVDDGFQACNDPEAWPFARIATEAAAWQPDLIIHVGDYIYRESPCPDGNDGCAGSPYGDVWATWEADFFVPAAPLLQAAPWVFVRGNHEDCGRAGDGWFRYLDPRPLPSSCLDYTDPYAFEIGDTRAVVLDSAAAEDITSPAEVTEAYRAQFAEVERLAGDGSAWLVTHRPFWSIGAGGSGNPTEWTTATYTDAGYTQPPEAIDLVIAGHVHMAQVLTFTEASGRPVQVVSGHAGTTVEMETGVFSGSDIGDENMARGWRWAEFGFVGLERVDSGWVATTPMLDGTTPLSCLVTETSAACVP